MWQKKCTCYVTYSNIKTKLKIFYGLNYGRQTRTKRRHQRRMGKKTAAKTAVRPNLPRVRRNRHNDAKLAGETARRALPSLRRARKYRSGVASRRYRSGLEDKIINELDKKGVKYEYEPIT